MSDHLDIETLRTTGRQAGVVHPVNLPFLLEPPGEPKAAIILVHGLTATPREMLTLAEKLVAEGYCCYGVRLSGHGTTPEDLAVRRLEEWQQDVASGVDALRKIHQKVFGIGLSTGALLLLTEDSRRSLDAMALLSPFLKLRHRLAPFAGLLSRLIPFQERPLDSSVEPFYYRRRPLHAIGQVNRLRHQVKPLLGRVTTPTLVLLADDDPTIDSGSGIELFRRLGGEGKGLHVYRQTGVHVLSTPENPHFDDTCRRISTFLKRSLSR